MAHKIDMFELGRQAALAGVPLVAHPEEDVARGHRNGTLEKKVSDAHRQELEDGPERHGDRSDG